jgi:Leucine-rich repeat (LRR) protein
MNKKIIFPIAIVLTIIVVVFFVQNKGAVKPTNNSDGSGSTISTSSNKILNLSNQGLTSIPSYVFSQTNLEELNISHNSLTGAIPAEIRNLKNLKVLNASYNMMTGVPAEIGQLQKLGSLDLSYNKLTGLPHEMGNLQNLIILNLTGNNYSQQDFDYIHSKLPPDTIIIAK